MQAVTFDFGNTLIRFRDREHHEVLRRFHSFVQRHVAACGLDDMVSLYTRIMNAQYAVYHPQQIENDMHERLAFLFWKLQGNPPTPDLVAAGMAAHCAAVVDTLVPPPDLKPVLTQLAREYKLGVISNYPYYEAIPAVLAAAGVRDLFGSIVVSAAVGTFKPNRRIFAIAAEELQVPLDGIIHVGDDIAADVVGAAAAGARAVYTREFVDDSHGQFLRYDKTELPDGTRTIDALAQLPALLAELAQSGCVAGEGDA
ncbi:MAG: HAD family hydrolase [Chloroflexota bacterium]